MSALMPVIRASRATVGLAARRPFELQLRSPGLRSAQRHTYEHSFTLLISQTCLQSFACILCASAVGRSAREEPLLVCECSAVCTGALYMIYSYVFLFILFYARISCNVAEHAAAFTRLLA